MDTMRIFALATLLVLLACDSVGAGILQWRNRVPAGEANPDNIGSYTNTIEIGNGGTTNYDSGLDIDLDTLLAPNDLFFVSYVDHDPEQVEYEFVQNIAPGESYTANLSFENRIGDSYFTSNTIEFLQVDGMYTYDLKMDQIGGGTYTYLDSGSVAIGELSPWQMSMSPGQDWRNGFVSGILTITNVLSDYDDNSIVNGLDFLEWQQTPTIDLSYWETQYGTTSAVAASVVPEPSSACLFSIAVVLAYSRKQHPHRCLL